MGKVIGPPVERLRMSKADTRHDASEPKADLAQRLIRWQRGHGRHDLPWQRDPGPYRVWVSEVMLQQTQVNTVIPYFERFMARFPDLSDLAEAPLDDVLALWSGLGYYSRARNLHQAAVICREVHGGELPRDFESLMALPGIGRSTAGAIQALARNEPRPILDGNAKRVLARFHAVSGWPGESRVARQLWSLAEAHTPRDKAATYTQAIMDLGAGICTRTRPACPACPLFDDCQARRQANPEAYPGRRPRRERPQRATTMLIIRDGRNRVLLERRPPSGVWGGLWSLPEVQDPRSPATEGEQRLGIGLKAQSRLEPVEHGFTHYRLTIHPWRCRAGDGAARIMDQDRLAWCGADEALSLGLPRPVRTLLESEFNTS